MMSFLMLTSAVRAEQVTITFVITAPLDTDPSSLLYVAGKLPGADWRADAIALKHQDSGEWRGSVTAPKGFVLEYKITGGSWETVEKGEQGEEVDNRSVTCDESKLEKVTVLKWRNPPTSQPSTKPAEPRASTATGDIRSIGIHSEILKNDRKISVWCPPGYESSQERYAVLYMHDGQNVFDDATSFAGEWRADETAAELIAAKKILPIILVGVENMGVSRAYEYTPTRDTERADGGGAELYARFLLEEVKPYIDSHFRTLPSREHTGVCGSSLGGLVSLFICDRSPEAVGLCGALSPSLWWDSRSLMMKIAQKPLALTRCKVWIDMGTDEGSGVEPAANVANAKEIAAIFTRAGMKSGANYQLKIAQGAGHNEAAWASRFGEVLVFLFGVERKT